FGLLVISETPAGAVKDGRVGPVESDAEPAGLDLDDHDPRLSLLLEPPDELAAVLGLAKQALGRDAGLLAGRQDGPDLRDEAAEDDDFPLLIGEQVLQQVHDGIELLGADLNGLAVV